MKRGIQKGKGVKVEETKKGTVIVTSSITLTLDEMEALKIICQIRKKTLQAVLEKEIKEFIYSCDPMSILP